MARVWRLRAEPFKYRAIKPPYRGHPRIERVYEPGWDKGHDGWYEDAMHPAAALQLLIARQLLAHLCPRGTFQSAHAFGAASRGG